jgi:hypothetical protein
MILSPGAKGWISKYLDLINKGEIIVSVEKPVGMSTEHFAHLQLSQTGLVFGIQTEFLFIPDAISTAWTREEKLSMLLFESHLFMYILNNGELESEEDFYSFVHSLSMFYGKHNAYTIHKLVRYLVKESKIEQLEKILSKRAEIRTSIFDSAIWVNYMSNSFVYLDVILYHEFIKTKKTMIESNYEDLALDVLKTIVISSYKDGEIQANEKAMFDVFLASANLKDHRKKQAIYFFNHGAKLTDLSAIFSHIWMFKRFLLDISVLTLYSKQDLITTEKEYLFQFCDFLHIQHHELDETIVLIEGFVLNHQDKIHFLQNKNVVEHLYSNISKRWIKILGRNKDKLAVELKQSKELIFLIKKSATEELTKEEKEKVKIQFLDIIKSMPTLAIFMLPGGALLLPIVLKIIPDLIPSAFRDNEIDSK